MKELLDTLATWQADGTDGEAIGRAVVVRTFGSAPRPEGAVLLYATDGRIAGSVSGGCVEGAAAEEIDRARATGHARVIRYGISDEEAWDVGLACGGTIDVLVEPVAPAAVIDAARGSVGAGGHGSAVITPLPADSPPGEFGPHQPGDGAPPAAELVVADQAELTGTLGTPELDAELVAAASAALKRGLSRTVELGGRSLFIEVFPVRPRLVVVGGVEVARSLVRLARELGFETVVVDGRAAFATPERFPDVDRLVVGWPDEVAEEIGLGPNDAVAVLSHDVKFDEPAIVEALRRGCRYVGAVGSKKTQADRNARLLEAGVSPADLARLRGPVGLDLGGRAPAETALAILAEIVAERYGGSGHADARASAGPGLTPVDTRPIGLVLAAGAGSRFGGGKLLRVVGGRPVLQYVLDALAEAGIDEVVVVLGADAPAVEAVIEWRGETRVVNPAPERGLSSSLQVGFAALPAVADAVLVALGDQPLVSVDVIRALVAAPSRRGRPIVVPVFEAGHGRNPVLLRRPAFGLVAEATGDRGLGPIIAAHPDLVTEIAATGDNPDVDTRDDLVAVLETTWATRVRANREQVDRFREVPDGTDFYAPVTSLFRADPTRTDDPVLGVLLDLVRSGDTWLDVGAGAGRFALPLARALDPSGGSVVALDASRSMLEGLREIADDYAIENVRVIEARWPPDDPGRAGAFEADVALIAHVGYDIEAIGPFLGALEDAADRLCVAVLMERVPASAADPFWPPVHGEARVALPAMPEVVEILEARGRRPSVVRVEVDPRRFETRDQLAGFVRRQLWIDPDGPKEARLQAALDELAVPDGDAWAIKDRGTSTVGIVTWSPR